MHYQKCFLEVRIMELDILDCMYMYMVFLAWERTTGANIYITESEQIWEKNEKSH